VDVAFWKQLSPRQSERSWTSNSGTTNKSITTNSTTDTRNSIPAHYNSVAEDGCVAVSDPYLDPFLDSTKVLRVGGRLQNSSLAFDEKHPMLLPAGHEVTRLIFENKHRQLKHCGPQALLANTRQQFWTIKGKQLALTTVRRCIPCCRARPRLLNQIMSPLPTDRVQIARPFNISGVDYCGPFFVHYKIQGKKSFVTTPRILSGRRTSCESEKLRYIRMRLERQLLRHARS